ncbi:DUF120 domain-containing protein [Candidatus Micrarchaeota archaeon]|nr:DUF120 domain-containing protein [Candidatus Micrarchaeota archaeon]
MKRFEANALGILFLLATKGAGQCALKMSTATLATEIGVSQQTVSRWLMELSEEGFVERGFNNIRLTPHAVGFLNEKQAMLKEVLHEQTPSEFRGNVVSGMEDGKYYLSLPEYRLQLKELLGYSVFPGTLNLRLSDSRSQSLKQRLVTRKALIIQDFRREDRLFGGALLYPAELHVPKNGRQTVCAIIVPKKSHYGPEVLEIVAKEYLRKKLHLVEGDAIQVHTLERSP